MGKPQKQDLQTVSEVAAIVTDELLSNEALRNIIELCIQRGLKKDIINERLDHLDSKVLDLQQKTDKYQIEVRDIKEIIESNGIHDINVCLY